MKEFCHMKLTEMVCKYGSTSFSWRQIKKLMIASVYPDRINKNNIRKDPYKTIPILVKWGINHSLQSKKLSIQYTHEAVNARMKKMASWILYLGYALHFITDRGTPHHSFTSKANPTLLNTISNAARGGILGSSLSSGEKAKEKAKKGFKTALATGLISLGIEVADLLVKHHDFEEFCDLVWEKHISYFKKYFKSQKKWVHPPHQLEQALRFLENKIEQLHRKSNNLSPNWISSCNLRDFADFMFEIALVMDIACQIVKK